MVERSAQDPDTGQEDLHTYLSSPLFSQKILCPRTSLVVSFSQIGDPEGCPVLFIPPAVCSRWFALPLVQLCQSSGIKLISIDRPGCGDTSPVPIEARLDISCKHMLSVMEYLKMEPRHIVSFSSGIYYHLHLLRYFHKELGGILQPMFVSPWLPDEKATAQTIKAMTTASILAFIQQRTPDEVPSVMVNLVTIEPAPNFNSSWRNRIKHLAGRVRGGSRRVTVNDTQTKWSKEIAVITTNYIDQEEHQGIAHEIILCQELAREWFKETFQALSMICKQRECILMPDIRYGASDTAVSKKSHLWLQNLINSTPEMSCKAYKIEGADPMDLLWSEEGMKRVFAMIHFRERVYYGG